MQTEDQEFDAELRAFVASFGCVQRTRYGRWLAWLDPTHDFVREGLQPPGQVNVYLHGEPTCTAQNSYWDGQPPIGFARGKPPLWRAAGLAEIRRPGAMAPGVGRAPVFRERGIGAPQDRRLDLGQPPRHRAHGKE